MARVIEPASEHELTWDAIDWSYHEEHVWRLQERIFRAARVRDWRLVKNLQKLLASSRSARLISVRRVTQLNRGKLTAGVDGVTCTNGAARMQLLEEISQLNSRDYRCQPALRMYIPKPSGGQRPLGIPTVKDRVMQAIVKLALEPEWEAKFEPNSYGFRPGRRCQDAIHQIRITVTKTRKRCGSAWILDADISKCFDSIDHDALLA